MYEPRKKIRRGEFPGLEFTEEEWAAMNVDTPIIEYKELPKEYAEDSMEYEAMMDFFLHRTRKPRKER